MDKTEKIGSSVIQHGPYNSRIYLMKLSRTDVPDIIESLMSLADKNKYEKIFCKVPVEMEELFAQKGFKREAFIPKYFNGLSDIAFMSYFLSQERENNHDSVEINRIVAMAQKKALEKKVITPSAKFEISPAQEEDAADLSSLYREVFATYPFPIHDPEYIKKTMRENISYFKTLFQGKIVSASSSEKDIPARAVEMTDFATLPSFRGNSLAAMLLTEMEKAAVKEGYRTFFTIARALSPGMNITFAKNGYTLSGTLVNNTNISGKIESMNVWYKNV